LIHRSPCARNYTELDYLAVHSDNKASVKHLFRIESGKLRELVFLHYALLMKPVWEYIVRFIMHVKIAE
jgi:uncharacterized membrane protein YvbJ